MIHEIRVRLYTGSDDDLISWLITLESAPYGARSQAIRDALRRGIFTPQVADANNPSQEVFARLAEIPTASQIRAIMEAALAEHTFTLGPKVSPKDEDETFINGLDALFNLQEEP